MLAGPTGADTVGEGGDVAAARTLPFTKPEDM